MSTATPSKEGYREFLCTLDDKKVVRLSVRHPDKKELESADFEYSGVFNQSLIHGLPTQAKMLRVLRENETISPKDEEEIGQLTEDLRGIETQIRKLPAQPVLPKDADADATAAHEVALKAYNDQRKPLSDRRAVAQRRLNVLNREIEAMLAHTADAKAGDAQRNFLVACVVEHVDGGKAGDRVWDGVDALLAEKDGSLLNRVMYEYMMCQADLPAEWDKLMGEDEPEPAKEAAKTTEAAKVVADAAAPATPVVPSADPAVEIKVEG